jgi:hypothetical protein
VTLARVANSELVQYRGKDKEFWTILTTRFSLIESDDRVSFEKLVGDKESELRGMAERYGKARAPNRLERIPVADDGVLLVLVFQGNRDGRMHSTVDFHSFWRDGSQVRGTVEWSGELEPKAETYIKHLATVRLKGGPNPTFEGDAPKSGARPSM